MAKSEINKKANLILILGILSIALSTVPLAGIVLAIVTFILFAKDKMVKLSMKAEVGKTLGIIGLAMNIIAAIYFLLFRHYENIPAWLNDIRTRFYSTAFYIDFENNFLTDNRYTYIFKGLLVTFQVTFYAVILGIVLGVIVALIRSSYDTMKDELKGERERVDKILSKQFDLIRGLTAETTERYNRLESSISSWQRGIERLIGKIEGKVESK